MIYLIDFFFIAGYLGMKDVALYMMDFQFDVYCRVRKYYMWFECSWVIGGILYVPQHSYTESAVAFFMCLTTKGIHDLIKKKTNRLSHFERSFDKNHNNKR